MGCGSETTTALRTRTVPSSVVTSPSLFGVVHCPVCSVIACPVVSHHDTASCALLSSYYSTPLFLSPLLLSLPTPRPPLPPLLPQASRRRSAASLCSRRAVASGSAATVTSEQTTPRPCPLWRHLARTVREGEGGGWSGLRWESTRDGRGEEGLGD